MTEDFDELPDDAAAELALVITRAAYWHVMDRKAVGMGYESVREVALEGWSGLSGRLRRAVMSHEEMLERGGQQAIADTAFQQAAHVPFVMEMREVTNGVCGLMEFAPFKRRFRRSLPLLAWEVLCPPSLYIELRDVGQHKIGPHAVGLFKRADGSLTQSQYKDVRRSLMRAMSGYLRQTVFARQDGVGEMARKHAIQLASRRSTAAQRSGQLEREKAGRRLSNELDRLTREAVRARTLSAVVPGE